MEKNYKQYTETLASREKVAAIIWLVIGIMQVLSFAGIFCGAYNIFASVSRFKQAKLVLTPYPGFVKSYDKWLTNIIIGIVINVIFGGVIGVACSIYDLIAVRGYVLENKKTFDEIEADPSLVQ